MKAVYVGFEESWMTGENSATISISKGSLEGWFCDVTMAIYNVYSFSLSDCFPHLTMAHILMQTSSAAHHHKR